MKVIHKGKMYRFKWKHNTKARKQSTTIEILEGENFENSTSVGIGFANVHPNDNYDKAKGRLISLGRALDVSPLRNQKDRIMSEYKKVGTLNKSTNEVLTIPSLIINIGMDPYA